MGANVTHRISVSVSWASGEGAWSSLPAFEWPRFLFVEPPPSLLNMEDIPPSLPSELELDDAEGLRLNNGIQ